MVKNVFSPELTIVRCFFFRGYIMVEVSATLKNQHFSIVMRFLTLRAGCLRAIFCINKVSGFCCKNQNSYQKFKIMLESCQETSKLSADSFMASWNRVVPQKSHFQEKNRRKTLKHMSTPPA